MQADHAGCPDAVAIIRDNIKDPSVYAHEQFSCSVGEDVACTRRLIDQQTLISTTLIGILAHRENQSAEAILATLAPVLGATRVNATRDKEK